MNTIANNKNAQDLLTEVKSIVESDKDLNHEKENLRNMLSQVNFLIGKYDHLFNPFGETFAAMAQMDFTRKIPTDVNNEDDELFDFVATGLNMVNEELEGVAFHKNLLHTILGGIDTQETSVLITDVNGKIYFVNSNSSDLYNFNENTLHGQNIHVVFRNFEQIDKKIKQLGSVHEEKVELEWLGEVIPKKLTLAIEVKLGKINSLIYILKKP